VQVGSRPIVIIADDLSGAAELAGIAYARGYTAEVQRQFEPASEAEVIAVDTDSRGLAPAVAGERVQAAAAAALAASPAWMFKKVDSMLRGNVRVEVKAMQRATGQQRALLVPANPSRGRTIAGGRYLIDGVPLNQTNLADDPQHPRTTAIVQELLGDGPAPSTLIVPDIASVEAIHGMSGGLTQDTLAAGAADFFASLLDHRNASSRSVTAPLRTEVERPALFVCGSRASWGQHAARCQATGVPVQKFPPGYSGERLPIDELPAWAREAAASLTVHQRLLLGIGPFPSMKAGAEPVTTLARLTAQVLRRMPIATLLIDGGATAAAVVKKLGWTRLAVTAPSPAGIAILQPVGNPSAPRVWIKPGSYPWPESVWEGVQ
jgi:D-threonate/D-erythronate kinase